MNLNIFDAKIINILIYTKLDFLVCYNFVAILYNKNIEIS